jgi:hypothetical protein
MKRALQAASHRAPSITAQPLQRPDRPFCYLARFREGNRVRSSPHRKGYKTNHGGGDD